MALPVYPLQPLNMATAVAPHNENVASKALTLIHRIHHIEVAAVVKYHGHAFHTIGVYFKATQSNIPTNHELPRRSSDVRVTKETNDVPNLVLQRRFWEFSHLRNELHYCALVGNEVCSCALCTNMVKLLQYGPALPRLRIKLFSDDATACRVLESFMNSVLRLMVETTNPNARRPRMYCDNKLHMPLKLYRFLQDQDDGEDAAASRGQKQKQTRRPPAIWAPPMDTITSS